jgi:hypothetical protein
MKSSSILGSWNLKAARYAFLIGLVGMLGLAGAVYASCPQSGPACASACPNSIVAMQNQCSAQGNGQLNYSSLECDPCASPSWIFGSCVLDPFHVVGGTCN